MKKEEILLKILMEREDSYVSGEELAGRLSVSRTAVWKGVEALRAAGYRIDSVTNRGYRLSSGSDVLSAAGIEKHLKTKGLRLRVLPFVTSTNTLLKAEAAEGAPEGAVLVAGEQTEGRGRMGRSFFSPPGSGLYLSLLLRPQAPAAETAKLTAYAAVAVAEALEEAGGAAEIKWVNDIYMGGRKVSGILTEAALDCERGVTEYAVVGIGVNLYAPEGGFPPELGEIAGAAFGNGSGDGNAETVPALRCRLAAAVIDRFFGFYRSDGPETARYCYKAYKRRSLVLGRRVLVHAVARPPEEAEAVDIAPDFSLVVRGADGIIRRVASGEVSVRVADAGL